MSLREMAALTRRHLLAMMVVLALAVGAGLDLKSSPIMYSEAATVVFTVSGSMGGPDAPFRPSLITTEMLMTETLLSPQARNWVGARGGASQFKLVPFNLYSMQYPNYAEPLASLTATSPSRDGASRTFRAVFDTLTRRLASMQARAGVPRPGRIKTYLAGDTGPVAVPGSRARTFGGLALLAVMAAFMVANFLDRQLGQTAVPRPSAP